MATQERDGNRIERDGNQLDKFGDWFTDDFPGKAGVRYFLGTAGTIAGAGVTGLGVESAFADQDFVKAGIEIAAGATVMAVSTNKLRMRERLGSLIENYVNEWWGCIVAIGVPFLQVVAQNGDPRILAAGEIYAAGSIAKGVWQNRHNHS